MGYRTVVILSNDEAHNWSKDPLLGEKIFESASKLQRGNGEFSGGSVVEQVHCDQQSLIVIDSLQGTTVATTHWSRDQTAEARDLALLRELAAKHGFNLSKKRAK